MQNTGIKAEKLTIQKGSAVILDGLDFAVEAGKITGLIGPSGSGKTMLMRTIVGVQKIKSGTVTVLGMPAGDKSLRAKVGYVTQSPAVYEDLTIQQNLKYFGTLAQAGRAQVDDILQAVHLDDRKHQLVANLSGGQRARVSLAIALLGDPEVLILDEPTVGLDPLLREELWQLFSKLAADGKTLIVSSHVMDEAERCDNLLLVRDGKLLWHDTRESLLAKTGTQSVQDAFLNMVKERNA